MDIVFWNIAFYHADKKIKNSAIFIVILGEGSFVNIFIFAANWYNHGDESAIRALIDELRQIYPIANIKIQFNQKVDNIPYADIEIIKGFKMPRRRQIISCILYKISGVFKYKFLIGNHFQKCSYNEFRDAVKWADIAIYAPGGPSIGDYYRQYQLVDMMLMMQACGTKYFIFAPSMGPFIHNREKIRQALKGAEMICFREPLSFTYFQELNIKKKAVITLDSAFQHKLDSDKYQRQFAEYKELNDFIYEHEKVVGMTITDLLWHPSYKGMEINKRIDSAFKGFIKKIISQGYAVLFIPQLFGIDDDFSYMKSYVSENCFIMEAKFDCYFQQYIISKLYALIGMRYHSNIFSAKMGIPFISVSYEQKMKGFMKRVSLEQYCIDVKELSYDKLIECFKQLVDNYALYKTNLLQKKEWLYKESHRTTDLLCTVIDQIII